MVKSNLCILDGRSIDIAEALELRDDAQQCHAGPLDLRCTQCGKPVRPHKESAYGAAHFEHLSRNPHCKLSDPAR